MAVRPDRNHNALRKLSIQLGLAHSTSEGERLLMPTLSHADASSPAVRASACGAVQALSRSAKDLRGELCRPAVAAALCRLLRDPAPPVQSAAVAALCNAVLEFSLLKARCARLMRRGPNQVELVLR